MSQCLQPGLPVAAPHAFDGKQASSDGSAFACAVWGWRWSRPDSVDTSCLVFTESRMSKVRPLCRYCLVQRRSINFTICAQIYAQMVKSMPNQRLMSRCRVKAESRLSLCALESSAVDSSADRRVNTLAVRAAEVAVCQMCLTNVWCATSCGQTNARKSLGGRTAGEDYWLRSRVRSTRPEAPRVSRRLQHWMSWSESQHCCFAHLDSTSIWKSR